VLLGVLVRLEELPGAVDEQVVQPRFDLLQTERRCHFGQQGGAGPFGPAQGQRVGVQATPSLYINGKKLPRIQDFVPTVDKEAQKKGFHNVLWLDGIERRYVEEAGLMNVAFIIGGTVVTPPLGGTILPGITRDSVLTLLRDLKLPVDERRITIDEVFEAHANGTLQGGAGIGTAAVICPLGRLRHKDREITVPVMGPDSPLMRAGVELEAIRLGKTADRHNWLLSI